MALKQGNSKKSKSQLAACNEVAFLYIGENGEPPIDRDIRIYSKSDKPQCLPIISQHVDPMVYPLMFPHGDWGWRPYMKCTGSEKHISAPQYYSSRLSVRNTFNPCLNLHKLTQQFVIDAWMKIESTRLYFIRKSQATLRTEMYKGSMDYVRNKAATENSTIGRLVILPSSFIGGPRAMHQHFIDATTLLQAHGKPDIFLTMTLNPMCDKVLNSIESHEDPLDRPDVVARVFHERGKI